MARYLPMVRIDWYYRVAPVEMRALIVEVNARFDTCFHTFNTFTEELDTISLAFPQLHADALVDDGYGNTLLFRVDNGKVQRLDVELHRDLTARLQQSDYTLPDPPTRIAGDKYEIALLLPASMVQFVQDEATRVERSMSWVAQYAWRSASPTIRTTAADKLELVLRRFSGDRRMQMLQYPGGMLHEIETEAQRVGRPQTFIAECAVAVAREQIRALPDLENR